MLVRELARRRHEVVYLVSSGDEERLAGEARQLLNSSRIAIKFFPLRVESNVLRRKWRSVWRPFSELARVRALNEALATELRDGYDVLHLEHLWTGWLGLGRARSLLNIHHFEIIDWEDRTGLSFYERKALFQMRRATRLILQGTSRVRAFTERIKAKVLELAPTTQCWVVPNALDASLYPMQPRATEPVVGMIGSMHWFPSRSAAERLLRCIWPIIKQKRPDARLLICGWNARNYLSRFLPLPDVQVEENLSDPVEFFRQVALLVYAPLRGSGMKRKVMESMAYGVPVVTNSEGAEGIEGENGGDCFVHEDDEALADCAVELLAGGDLRERVRRRARALIEDRYSPARVVGQLLDVYDAIRT
jgi:glycosyltransferase involved in cell wall biosynthesis